MRSSGVHRYLCPGVRLRNLGAIGIVAAAVQSTTFAGVVEAAEGGAESTCPTRAAVDDAVRALVSRAPGDGAVSPTAVDVRDFGDRYVVTVKGGSREYTDEARDCGARARAAAVFVALTLAPSSNATPASPAARLPEDRAVAPPPSDIRSAPPAPGPVFQGTEIELGALGAMAPRTDRSQFVVGAELRFIVTRGTWGLALGGSLPTSSTLDLSSVSVGQSRYPLDLGIRRAFNVGWFRGGLELGAVAAICRLRQADSATAAEATRGTTHLELGVRAGATLAAESPRVGLYLRVFSEVVPMTQPIAVEPQGVIGRTSAFWAGVSVGVTARFH